jgi:hypothetical protein
MVMVIRGSCFACRSFQPLDSFVPYSLPVDAENFIAGVLVATLATKKFASLTVVVAVNDDPKRALVGVFFGTTVTAKKQIGLWRWTGFRTGGINFSSLMQPAE